MLLVLALVLGQYQPSIVSHQGKPGAIPWPVTCTNCSSGGGGGLTDAQLRATAVPVSGSLTCSGPLTDTQLRASAVPVSGTFYQATQPVSGSLTCNAGSGTLAVSLATAPTTPVTGTFWQATQPVSIASMPSTPVTGSFFQATQPVSGTLTCNAGSGTLAVSLASAPTTAVTNAGLSNLDVALSTRTKPADQQHTIIDSSAAIAVTGPATDTQLRAVPLPVSGTVAVSAVAGSVAVTGTFFQGTQPVSGTVAVSNFPASQAVTGTFWQTTQPVSVASLPVAGVYAQGPDGGTTFDVSGSVVTVASSAAVPNRFPLNPFLPRCNPVRRTGCQP